MAGRVSHRVAHAAAPQGHAPHPYTAGPILDGRPSQPCRPCAIHAPARHHAPRGRTVAAMPGSGHPQQFAVLFRHPASRARRGGTRSGPASGPEAASAPLRHPVLQRGGSRRTVRHAGYGAVAAGPGSGAGNGTAGAHPGCPALSPGRAAGRHRRGGGPDAVGDPVVRTDLCFARCRPALADAAGDRSQPVAAGAWPMAAARPCRRSPRATQQAAPSCHNAAHHGSPPAAPSPAWPAGTQGRHRALGAYAGDPVCCRCPAGGGTARRSRRLGQPGFRTGQPAHPSEPAGRQPLFPCPGVASPVCAAGGADGRNRRGIRGARCHAGQGCRI